MTRPNLPVILLLASSILVALASWRFVALDLVTAYQGMDPHILNRRALFLAHIVASPIALGVGAVQFLPRLRARRPGLHRWLGRLYAAAILVGGLAGLGLALDAVGGPVAGWGFGLLAVLWLAATAQAVRLAMLRRISAHRVWMIRSFALTFAAVTLRLQMPVLLGLGMDYPEASQILAWSCWVPNLAIAEWLVRRKARDSVPAAASAQTSRG
jgi:uncharacterized membrane protein